MLIINTDASMLSTVSGSTEYDLDYIITEPQTIYGGTIVSKNGKFGDYIQCSIYASDGITLVMTIINKLYLLPTFDGCYTVSQTGLVGAKVSTDMILRVKYNTVDTNPRDVIINYNLQKVI